MISLPSSSKKWVQDNSSDLKGNIFITKNITFDTDGYIELSKSSRVAIDSTIDSNMNHVGAFVRSQDHGYLALTGDDPFAINESKILAVRPTISATGLGANANTIDGTFTGGLLVATRATSVMFYNPTPNTWTDTSATVTSTSTGQHPVEKFVSLNSFAVADLNTIKIYPNPITATPTATVTLTIPSDFYITSLAYFNQNLFIGTMNVFGGHAFLYVWNGFSSAAQSAYEVDSNIIYDVCVHKDSITIVTGNGQLLKFNGSGFTVLENFPAFYENISLCDETSSPNMYHNCLKSSGDLLYINLSSTSNVQKLLSQPDGIWCYDSTLGILYHRFSISNSLVSPQTITAVNYNTTTNQITVTSAPITGTEVIHDAFGATPASPLIDGKRYYTIYVDATHVKLATTKANALAGTAIDLISAPSANTKLVFFPNYDFGQYFLLSQAGALLPIERIMDYPQYGTEILWGQGPQNTANSSKYSIGTVTGGVENRGYIITPKIFSQNITDTFNQFTIKFSEFLSDNDEIVIKYRLSDDRKSTITASGWLATWTSTTTFTTTETEFADAGVGDEVEFLTGGGAGICAHITAISGTTTFTVTIDETYDYYTSGDKATFIFRNWIKWQSIVYGDTNADQGFLSSNIGVTGKYIQFKIELRGVRVRIEEIHLDNIYHLPTRR